MKASKDSYSLMALMVALLAAAEALGGCATTSSSPTPVAPVVNTAPLELAVRVCDSGTPNCPGETKFSLGSLRDLQVNVDWKNMPGGTHTQEIAFLLPNGVVYQSVSQGFGVTEGALGSPTVGGAMPVAGTYITQRELTGQWTVQVSLDGKAMATQTVEFQP